ATSLQNPSFDNGSLSPWVVTNQNGGNATASLDTSTYVSAPASANVNVTSANSTNPWYVEFHQYNLQLATNTPYLVTFYAMADKPRQIESFIQQQGGSYSVFTDKKFSLTTSWQLFTMTMSAQASFGTTY